MLSNVEYNYEGLDEAFPDVDPLITPVGARILVQFRLAKTRTKSGIILTNDQRETEMYNTQIAKVIALGPLAFKNRTTLEAWPEGAWCNAGEYVRMPKYGGDRWAVDYGDEQILFAEFNDSDVLGRVHGNPLAVRAYL